MRRSISVTRAPCNQSDRVSDRIRVLDRSDPHRKCAVYLPARDCTDDQEWFCPVCNRMRQRRIGRFMRQIFAAGKKSDHRPASLGYMITYCPPQHWIFGFNSVQERALSYFSVELKVYFAIDIGERTQMRRKNNAYHGNDCTSTESTAGKSRTMGFHVSPASADA
jgi:hypothetical protein